MDSSERHEKERQAWRRKRAQQIRAGFLRGRVFAVSLLCFGALWAVVFIQMATGNDPVLSAKTRTSSGKRAHRHQRAAARRAEIEAVEEPATEAELEAVEEPAVEAEAELVEPEVAEEAEVIEEPEAELEPLTTEQS